MLQVDAARAVELVEAADHVVRLAGAGDEAGGGDDARAVMTGDGRGHGPEPGLLDAMERLLAGFYEAVRGAAGLGVGIGDYPLYSV